MKKFYRIANAKTTQGVWYDALGNFTGLIHNEFNFCQNHLLLMPFDPNIVGYLSATDSIEELLNWFPLKDIVALEKYGYRITVYESSDYKYYNNHWLINQSTASISGYTTLSGGIKYQRHAPSIEVKILSQGTQ